MMIARGSSLGRDLLLTALLLMPGTSPASAASAWVESQHSAVRLLDGGTAPGGRAAGVEVRLDPSFITYWRSAGESGVAPTFDFSGSVNVKRVTVAFPAPRLVDEDGTQAYGYEGSVIFPLSVTSDQVGAPVRLDLVMDYAVCSRLCLPAKARLHLTLDGLEPTDAARVAGALAQVPRAATLGGAGPIRIDAVWRPSAGIPSASIPSAKTMTVEATTPDGTGSLFVEAPEPWYYVASSGKPGPGGHLGFTLTAPDPPPPGPLPAEPMRLTLVTSSGSVEVPVRLDAVPVKP